MRVKAKLYDGVSSKEHIVDIEFSNNRVKIEEFDINLPLDEVKIHSRLGNTPRLIEFPNNIRCKVEDHKRLEEALEKAGFRASLIHKIERSWKLAVASIAIIGAFVVFMLTAGADISANFLANMLPKDSLDYISKKTLHELDKSYLQKSNLTKAKKEEIKRAFLKIADSKYKLHFRSSPKLGPNAFALPSGDIVILDELILLEKDKDYRGILGVLAHEKAHVVKKHALRGIIKGAIAATIISYITGDVSFIATTLPTIVVTNSYSREFEKEADIYAKEELKRLNISTKPLAKLFIKMEEYYNKKYKDSIKIPSIFSTHPETQKRVEFFMKD